MNAQSFRKWAILVFALGLLLVPPLHGGSALAQAPGQERPYDEDEALSIDRMLICPVCPAETIDQAQVEISRQMRDVVRQMLGDQASRDEILDFFVARYGEQVLAAPPKSGVNLLAWVLPIAGVLAGIGGVFFVIRAMASRGAGTIAAKPMVEEGLEPYLEVVDRDLALSSGWDGRTTGGASDRDDDDVQEPREGRLTQDG